MTDVWTSERIDTLRQLVDKGDSFSLIAVKLGGGISRNAAIGKAHRLKMPRRKPIKQPVEAVIKPGPIRSRAPSKPSLRPSNPNLKLFVPKAIPTKAPESENVTIIDVTGCKFSTGQNKGGEYVFCNAPVDDKSSYCPFHHALVTRKPKPPLSYRRF